MVDIGKIFGVAIEDIAKINGVEIATGYKLNGLDISLALTGDIGLICGGYVAGYVNVIQYITITSTGNATDFGDLSSAKRNSGAAASSTRALIAGGESVTNVIEYITIVNKGNATDFGDLSAGRYEEYGMSNATRALWMGGYEHHPGYVNTIEYSTIASTGNATDFGDLLGLSSHIGSATSTTRGVMGGFYRGGYTNIIEYVTIAAPSNSTDFGDLSVLRNNPHSGCGSSTRALFQGGYDSNGPDYYNVIDYVTIASTGNAADFGDLTVGRYSGGGIDNSTRGVLCGGFNGSAYINVIDYVTIASTGNAADFGDLLSGGAHNPATSNCHGGLS